MKIIKKAFALLLIISLLFLSSCGFGGMQIAANEDYAAIIGYSGLEENVYFPPTYNGVRVEYISGKKDSYFIGSSRTATFEGPNLKRVYFPWSAHSLDYKSITGEVYHRFPKDATVVFTACYDIIDASKIVVPSGTLTA